MNGYSVINVYRGLWRLVGQRGGEYWEKVTWRPGHVIAVVLPEYLNTYDARAEYPELTTPLGAPYWAGLWWWNGQAWQQHRTWSNWSDTGGPLDDAQEKGMHDAAGVLLLGFGVLLLASNL